MLPSSKIRQPLRWTVIYLATAAALAAAGVAAPTARAAGEIGRSSQAHVICDHLTNTVTVTAMFGAGTAYESQYLAYELYLQNANTGAWTRLLINNQRWHVIRHQRVTRTYEYSIPTNSYLWETTTDPWAPTPALEYRLADGNYYVFARYAWNVGGVWRDANGNVFGDAYSPWAKTTSYDQMFGMHGASYCLL